MFRPLDQLPKVRRDEAVADVSVELLPALIEIIGWAPFDVLKVAELDVPTGFGQCLARTHFGVEVGHGEPGVFEHLEEDTTVGDIACVLEERPPHAPDRFFERLILMTDW